MRILIAFTGDRIADGENVLFHVCQEIGEPELAIEGLRHALKSAGFPLYRNVECVIRFDTTAQQWCELLSNAIGGGFPDSDLVSGATTEK